MVDLPQILSCGCTRHILRTQDHVHPGLELVLVDRGAASLETAVGTLSGGPGTLFILPPGSHHDQRSPAGSRSWYLVCSAASYLDVALPAALRLAPGDVVRRWLPDLIRLHEQDGPRPHHRHVLAGILQRLEDLRGEQGDRGPLPSALQRIFAAVRADPLDDRTTATLADIAGISQSHLRALFADHVGTSPMEWCRLQRLHIAQKLLRSSFLSIAAIAAQTGWIDANYFTRYFRARTGMSPRAWRTAHTVVRATARRRGSTSATRAGGR